MDCLPFVPVGDVTESRPLCSVAWVMSHSTTCFVVFGTRPTMFSGADKVEREATPMSRCRLKKNGLGTNLL